MLILFLAVSMALIITALLLYEAVTYKATADIKKITHIVQRACDEIDTVLVQENEPPKAEDEGMLLPYPEMK